MAAGGGGGGGGRGPPARAGGGGPTPGVRWGADRHGSSDAKRMSRNPAVDGVQIRISYVTLATFQVQDTKPMSIE